MTREKVCEFEKYELFCILYIRTHLYITCIYTIRYPNINIPRVNCFSIVLQCGYLVPCNMKICALWINLLMYIFTCK